MTPHPLFFRPLLLPASPPRCCVKNRTSVLLRTFFCVRKHRKCVRKHTHSSLCLTHTHTLSNRNYAQDHTPDILCNKRVGGCKYVCVRECVCVQARSILSLHSMFTFYFSLFPFIADQSMLTALVFKLLFMLRH